MFPIRWWRAALGAACLWNSLAHAGDVSSYSVMKGRFLNQTGPVTLVLDPDFSYSFLASVEMPDNNLLKSSAVHMPNGKLEGMEDLGDYWAFLDSHESYTDLTASFGWGTYVVDFTTVSEGAFSCELKFPNTTLPPNLHLVNFDEIQAVDASKPLTLRYEFSTAPHSNDLVQVYINQGHAEVFSTPPLGEPGALDVSMRSLTIPAGTLAPGGVYSLNLEITRLASTNATAYPGATGFTATFSSTSAVISTLNPPKILMPGLLQPGEITLLVLAEPGRTLVLESAESLSDWHDLATNSPSSRTNVFTCPTDQQSRQFYRARIAN